LRVDDAVDEHAVDETVSVWNDTCGQGLLGGVRVLDVSQSLAGPFAAMTLGDLGADVIKVEPPTGDVTRSWGPPFLGETAAYYYAANRHKRSVVLDLKDPEQAEAAAALAATADVVIANFLPGVAERYGLDDASIRAVNPRCVHCSIGAFGIDSAWSDRKGFDLVMQAHGGLMSITGTSDGAPVKVGIAIADLSTGLYATIGILSALFAREQTGVGRKIDVSLLDSITSLLSNQAMSWLLGGVVPQAIGSDHGNVAPYAAFRTADRHIVIAVGSDQQFRTLTDVIGAPELAQDPRYATNTVRVEHRDALRDDLERALAARPASEWLARLAEAGVPSALVHDLQELFEHPTVDGRLVTTVSDPVLGEVRQLAVPLLVDGARPPVRQAPPPLGNATDSVLRALARAAATTASTEEEEEACPRDVC
jgi:crotonobetainyl-CoA:carnitine CoA-transferase CaiB-like acyl-CoA transferase